MKTRTKRIWCRIGGHREFEFEWENGSVSVDCQRCGKILHWYVPSRYFEMGPLGTLTAQQENSNEAERKRMEKAQALRSRVEELREP